MALLTILFDILNYGTMMSKGMNMYESLLINKNVNIGFSEPWDLLEKLEKDNLIGSITDIGTNIDKYYGYKDECLIINLTKGFQYDDLDCKYFLVSPRHEGSRFADLLKNNTVNCSFLRITKEQANSDDRFNTDWWRGGGGFTATIKL